jgi:carbon storage regulator
MLVLSRRCRESVVLPADGVTIRVLEIRANRVRLGIEAPSGVSVLRGELICDVDGREAAAPREPALQGATPSGASSGPSHAHRSAGSRPLRNAVAGARVWKEQPATRSAALTR